MKSKVTRRCGPVIGLQYLQLSKGRKFYIYVGEYQKYVKLFFSLFLDNTLPVRIAPVFFEVYLTGISEYNHKPFEARRSWWKPLSIVSEIGNLV